MPSVTNTASVAGGGEPAANNGNNSDSDPTTVIAANQPPVVDAGGPYTGDEGSAIALNTATATDPDAGDTPTYKWTYVAQRRGRRRHDLRLQQRRDRPADLHLQRRRRLHDRHSRWTTVTATSWPTTPPSR